MLTLLCTSAEMNIASWYLNTHFHIFKYQATKEYFSIRFSATLYLIYFTKKKPKKNNHVPSDLVFSLMIDYGERERERERDTMIRMHKRIEVKKGNDSIQ